VRRSACRWNESSHASDQEQARRGRISGPRASGAGGTSDTGDAAPNYAYLATCATATRGGPSRAPAFYFIGQTGSNCAGLQDAVGNVFGDPDFLLQSENIMPSGLELRRVYRFTSLRLEPDGRLSIAGDFDVALAVDQDMVLGDRFAMSVNDQSTLDSGHLFLYSGGAWVEFGHDSALVGNREAPLAHVEIRDHSFVRCALAGRSLTIGFDAIVGPARRSDQAHLNRQRTPRAAFRRLDCT
jgi:hypothetical protein